MTDRELDALIAEKVMGLSPMKGKGMDGGYWDPVKKRTQMIKDSPLHDARKKLGIAYDAPGDGFLLNYSSDIGSAWTVVEKMRDGGWNICLATVKKGSAAVITKEGRFTGDEPYAESMPRAICLAALKAVGVDTGGSK